ncbi:MAG: hypothetical protein VKJ04_01615 [Vampirovibrionales bacterium]|nr:hypothetical protein [Vampirovibrionales bacterium]
MSNRNGSRRYFRINNMTGLVNTMAEDNAYLTLDPNANLGVGFSSVPFEFKRVENFLPTNRGGLSKTFGYTVYHDVGSAVPITGLYRYIRANDTSHFMLSYGDSLYTLLGGSLSAIGMSISNGALVSFETAYDKLIVCDGVGGPQTYDGSSVASLTSGDDVTAALGARQAVFHQNRMFLFSTSHDQSLLYYSEGGLIGQGYASNFVNCNVNDGQKITAIARFFIPGDLQPVLIVAKERSLGVVIGDGTLTNPYTYIKVAEDIGVPGFRQIVQFEQDAAFFTKQGICSYQSSQSNDNLERRMLSKNIANQFTSLSSAYLSNALGWLDWKRRRVTFAVPEGSSQYANKLWHYDTDLGGFYAQTGFDVTSVMVDTDGTVYTGTSSGQVLVHEENVHAYGGEKIQGIIQTPYLDFFEPHYYKRIVDGRVIVRGNGSYNLGISAKTNNGIGIGSSHTVALSGGAYTWGAGNWSDDGAYQWATAPLTRNKFFPGGIFENISFTITQNGKEEPVDFLEMILEVEYLNLS